MPERQDGRNGAIWNRYIAGHTQAALAEEYGISEVRVCQIIKNVRASIPEQDKSELIQESIELIRRIEREAFTIADMDGAPVAVGKDGSILYDPVTNAVVRDYSGRVKALDLALKANDVLSKRLGLDAAAKTESTSTVRYTLDGVNPNADLK